MEISILIFALLVESAILLHRLSFRSTDRKTRSIVDLAVLGVFIVLFLLAVIPWSFRWYGLAALFGIRAASGLAKLTKASGIPVEYQPRKVILHSSLSVLLVFLAVTPALVFPEYRPLEPTGPYSVTSNEYTFIDEHRREQYSGTGGERKVTAEFWYPDTKDGAYPLVIFSHGGLGSKRSNISLFAELASHGYVVVSIEHAYQTFWSKHTDGSITLLSKEYLLEILSENAKTNKEQSFAYYQKWMKVRTGDINLVIDTILNKSTVDAGGVYNLIDPERIGVMGHSLGGSAALGIGRLRDDIRAVVALESPFLYDIEGVKDGEFVFVDEAFPVPVLNIYSDASWSHLAEWTQYAENVSLLANTEATAFNVYLRGVGHFSLTDLALASPILTRVLNQQESTTAADQGLKTINKVCLEFFNSYLKDAGAFTSSGFY